MVPQCVRCCGGTLFQKDRDPNFFTESVVGHTKDRTLGYIVVIKDGALNLCTVNVFTATQHHVFDSVHDENEIVFVLARHIASPQPTVHDGFCCGFLSVEVTANDVGTAYPKFTGFSGRHLFAGIRINNFTLIGRHGRTTTGGLVDKMIAANRRDDAACFRHAITGIRSCRRNLLVNFSHEIWLQLGAAATEGHKA